jgi:hypothetical protein
MVMAKKEESAVIIPREEKGSHLAILLSRVDHPVELSYDGKGLMVYPRGRTTPLDKNKLGAVPKGVQIIDVAGRG